MGRRRPLTWDEYADVDRVARATPLNRAQREQLCPTLARVRELLESRQLRTWSDLCWEVTDLLDATTEPPYRHVVADEVQDFGPAELRLLRALAPERPDDVFLTGDAHQRSYQPRTGQLLRDRARPAVANAGLQAHELADHGESAPKRSPSAPCTAAKDQSTAPSP